MKIIEKKHEAYKLGKLLLLVLLLPHANLHNLKERQQFFIAVMKCSLYAAHDMSQDFHHASNQQHASFIMIASQMHCSKHNSNLHLP